MPERILPISTSPPADIELLIGEHFTQVQELLRPGNRKRVEARAALRGLLALESHVSEEVEVNERDVNCVENGVREGGTLEQVFPRLSNLGTTIAGEGPGLTVHFTKRQGAPVTFITADDPREAAAVRAASDSSWTVCAHNADASQINALVPAASVRVDHRPACLGGESGGRSRERAERQHQNDDHQGASHS